MRALIFKTDSRIRMFEGSFDEAKAHCGWDTAQRIKVNGHVWLAVDEGATMRIGAEVNPVASFIADQLILGNAFLVLEN